MPCAYCVPTRREIAAKLVSDIVTAAKLRSEYDHAVSSGAPGNEIAQIAARIGELQQNIGRLLWLDRDLRKAELRIDHLGRVCGLRSNVEPRPASLSDFPNTHSTGLRAAGVGESSPL
jgi:hypothetical protein